MLHEYRMYHLFCMYPTALQVTARFQDVTALPWCCHPCCRYDVMHNFSTSYFNSVFAGYTFGLALTIVVMNVFNAAQPALLYIVPAVLGAVALHAWQRKEFTKVGLVPKHRRQCSALNAITTVCSPPSIPW